MNKKILTAIAMCGMVAGLAQADVWRYRLSGDWSTVTDGTSEGWGLNPNNSGAPGTGLPGAADDARINWGGNTVTVTTVTPSVSKVQIGVDESGNVIVDNGGVLNANRVYAGHNNVNATGTLTVNNGGTVNVADILYAANNSSAGTIDIASGGIVNVGSHLWLGATGTATIDISGTLTQTGGILGLGTSNASTAGGGVATVNILDGGLLNLWNISGNELLPSIQAGSLIDIQGSGQLTLPGDFVGVLQNYVAANKIIGNGVNGNVSIDLTTNPGSTTVTAIPEPATIGLFAAFGGAIVFLRRFRM